ncbi:MAG: SDR family NAD(P)-dependent oxidoreductase [Candidatus Woesearchaeota archaeon]
MKILVTGGAGLIGSIVCRKLLEKDHIVVCIDNLSDNYGQDLKQSNIDELKSSFPDSFIFYKADITDMDGIKEIFSHENIEKIIHLAAMAGVRPSIEKPMLYSNVNIIGLQNLLESARKYNIKKFVSASSSSVYGDREEIPFKESDNTDYPISPYAATKKAGEVLCYTYHSLFNINIICLRFFTVYGPGGRPDMAIFKFTRLIDEQRPITVFGDGSSKRDYTFVSDICDGIISALDADLKFEIINLGDNNPIELNYLISLIEKNLGKKAIINRMAINPGDVTITCADISKAKKLLNYSPKIKIEDGIRIFVEWYKNYKTKD